VITNSQRAIRSIIVSCLLVPLVFQAANAADELKSFVTRQGDQLLVGDKPLRFISFNIPNLLVVEDAYSFTSPNPWRWPDEFEIEDALESVRQLGGQVVRTYVISVAREGSDMGDAVHVLAPGKFNEEAFRTLDKVLEIANRKGIRVIIPLVDNWKWMGGVPQYAAFRNKPQEAFWSDPEIIADFKQTIEYVLNRKNTYTSVRYRDDPAIFGWETGNEIDATEDWTREIAAYLKQLDPNHLVVDGRTLHGVEQWQLDEPNTDVLSTHHYPRGPGSNFVKPIRAAHALAKGKKPYFVGEFGFVDTPHLKRVMDATIQDGIPGALLWSLRFHRREGGFYWHMEVGTGGNFYKAYHWPGFASGKGYDEIAVLKLLRDKAFEIQGITPPAATEPPAAPKLLAIDTPAAISWQGSAGAVSYNVQRATSAEGPWTTIGTDVTDAEVQYRPLFADTTAIPGTSHFYRVVARNSGGDSAPSNIVGPVAAKFKTLVDECRDFDQLAARTGDVKLASDNVRRVQEDSHRFALAPGSSITYQVEAPIRAWRVFAFAETPNAKLKLAASADGQNFEPLDAKRAAFSSGQGDYGYLVPIRFSAATNPASSTATHLRIELPASVENSEPVQISRVEIDYGH
jgi:mannan endo-1,4-beta-mannosidase